MGLLTLAFRAGHLDLSMFGDALDDGKLFVALPALIFVCGHFCPPFLQHDIGLVFVPLHPFGDSCRTAPLLIYSALRLS